MADIPGIGQDKPDLKVVKEEYPLPGNRKEVLIACENILKKNGVKKLVIELGQPIRVERYVKYDAVGPSQEIIEDDLYFAVRNADIEVYVPGGPDEPIDGLRAMFYLFNKARSRGLVPKAILVNNYEAFYKWLDIRDIKAESAFGVDIAFHKEVPEDVLLFVCSKSDEPDVIAVTFQTNMEQ